MLTDEQRQTIAEYGSERRVLRALRHHDLGLSPRAHVDRQPRGVRGSGDGVRQGAAVNVSCRPQSVQVYTVAAGVNACSCVLIVRHV